MSIKLHQLTRPLSAKDFSGGDATAACVLTELGFEMIGAGGEWSEIEADLIVTDYLNMLILELTGKSYNKSARRRALLERLRGRSEASIEFKHANISAVMVELGFSLSTRLNAPRPFSARQPDQRSRRNIDAFSAAGRGCVIGCRTTGTGARADGLLDHQGSGPGQIAPR